MRVLVLALLTSSLLLAGDGPKEKPTKPAPTLWAGVSVSDPVYESGIGQKHFMIHFAVVNDGDKIVNPDTNSSQLLVNGKELKDWSFIVANGPRDDRWNALPPRDFITFSIAMEDCFAKPGIYKVVWKGKAFQAHEIEFRVLPKAKD